MDERRHRSVCGVWKINTFTANQNAFISPGLPHATPSFLGFAGWLARVLWEPLYCLGLTPEQVPFSFGLHPKLKILGEK